MPAHITLPAVVLAAHEVTAAQIRADVSDRHPDHPRLQAMLRVVEGCGVRTRYFTRPLTEAATDTGVEHRVRTAFADACAMATIAAQKALSDSGLAAADIDAIVTSHSTSWAVPGLDVHCVASLGLRPDVTRIPLTTLACAGGAQALIRAADFVRARPGSKVLVLVAEVLSAIYHRADNTMESVIYKALFGDSAGACVVSDAVLGPGFAIESTFEYLLPCSQDRYWGQLDAAGMHFASTKKAATAPRDALPAVLEWLGDWRPSFAVVHPGGPRIITEVADGLGLRDADVAHSFDSLAENGNLGGNAVLDVLRRTHGTPPEAGSGGMLVAFGPGFALAGARGHWV